MLIGPAGLQKPMPATSRAAFARYANSEDIGKIAAFLRIRLTKQAKSTSGRTACRCDGNANARLDHELGREMKKMTKKQAATHTTTRDG
jgi:hypothetical protein